MPGGLEVTTLPRGKKLYPTGTSTHHGKCGPAFPPIQLIVCCSPPLHATPPDLTHIDLPFYNCYQLAQVTYPPGLTRIGDRAFYGCNRLASPLAS